MPGVRHNLFGTVHRALASKGATLALVVTYPNILIFIILRRNY